ncbi:MAG TPA: glycerate kinase [Phycisphaerales bacterium]|nr:glycerate kinase [Phycisphaerales bacterium]HCD32436.1 glycerate kinase [Phycisphaerales bacterium]
MKIICAPDSFKESISATDAAHAMQRGILNVYPEAHVEICPIADGGEGTLQAMVDATGGEYRQCAVTGPLGQPVKALWGLLGQQDNEPLTAVIEMAQAAGIHLVEPDQRNPSLATTYGVGELIREALSAGAHRIVMGIGGSCTNDGGAGMAQALGVHFFDRTGEMITRPMTGSMLPTVERIDKTHMDPRIEWTQIIAACDVNNPLTGALGASVIYGPQKGASQSMVEMLDEALVYFAELVGGDFASTPGAGAAGGLGFGLLAFLDASLQRGIDLVLDTIHFDQRCIGATLCLTGEGKLDGQSLQGKACLGVARRANMQGVRTVALVGCIGDEAEKTLTAGLAEYHLIGPDLPAEVSMTQADRLIEETTVKVLQAAMV